MRDNLIRDFRFSYISYFEQYREFDYFLTPPEYPNPWTSDNTEFWEMKWVWLVIRCHDDVVSEMGRFEICESPIHALKHLCPCSWLNWTLFLILNFQQGNIVEACEEMGL